MISYSSYLKVPELLNLQKPRDQVDISKDETLFIIIHQVYELWFKVIHEELNHIEKSIEEKRWDLFFSSGQRIERIFSILIQQVHILETMSFRDFHQFRKELDTSSGFQSFQFRLLEFRLGRKNKFYLDFYHGKEKDDLISALNHSSLYEQFLDSFPYKENKIIVLEKIYKEKIDPFFRACEWFLDLESWILKWRFGHRLMVERMIGSQSGTGGSLGVKYLEKTMNDRFFPEIWNIRNSI